MKRKTFFAAGLLLLLSGIAAHGQAGDRATDGNEKRETPGEGAQGQTPPPVVFRFDAGSDMFYQRGNEAELQRLFDFVGRHRKAIRRGELPVYVDGYCAGPQDEASNLRTARLRSNRVKGELILRKRLREENFVTDNHAQSYDGVNDAVVVSFVLRDEQAEKAAKEQAAQEAQREAQRAQEAAARQAEQAAKEAAERTAREAAVRAEQAEKARAAEQARAEAARQEQQAKGQQAASEQRQPEAAASGEGGFSIRTNLLYWVTATPNLGVEWKPSAKLGILVNGAFSHWIWSGEDKHHRTWLVQPEVRWYLCQSRHWFVGVEGHAGQFNFKFNDTGYQGDAIGGGLTGGYRIALSKCFDMDFSLGLGYTNIKYDTYYRSNGVSVKKETGLTKDFFGPTQAGVSLIFKL